MSDNQQIYRTDPLGVRAIKLGLITRQQLETALQTQDMVQMKGDTLGDVLVDLGFVDSSQYHEILMELLNQPVSGARKDEDVFCTLACGKGYVTESQIDTAKRAVSTRQKRRKLLGQILVELGLLTEDQLTQVLATYESPQEQ